MKEIVAGTGIVVVVVIASIAVITIMSSRNSVGLSLGEADAFNNDKSSLVAFQYNVNVLGVKDEQDSAKANIVSRFAEIIQELEQAN